MSAPSLTLRMHDEVGAGETQADSPDGAGRWPPRAMEISMMLPSTTSVERAFSELKRMLSARRSRLGADLVEALVVVASAVRAGVELELTPR